ncbi:phage major tail tube protein, partial [Escherichia coli]
MAMPRKLKLMNVFLNGYSYQGVAKSVTLPKLTRKLENYRGAGMNGSAPVDLGLDDDALSMEWSLGGFPDSVIWELYAATGVDAVPIRFAGSYQRDDTGETVAVEVVSSYAGYQAYQPVTAPAGRSYVDQSKNEYHISLTGGTAPGTQL